MKSTCLDDDIQLSEYRVGASRGAGHRCALSAMFKFKQNIDRTERNLLSVSYFVSVDSGRYKRCSTKNINMLEILNLFPIPVV